MSTQNAKDGILELLTKVGHSVEVTADVQDRDYLEIRIGEGTGFGEALALLRRCVPIDDADMQGRLIGIDLRAVNRECLEELLAVQRGSENTYSSPLHEEIKALQQKALDAYPDQFEVADLWVKTDHGYSNGTETITEEQLRWRVYDAIPNGRSVVILERKPNNGNAERKNS